jgi:hypothetical protein
MINPPATPAVPAAIPATSPARQPGEPQVEISQSEAAIMVQWAKEDLLAGKITQAQADKQFAELNTPLDQRGPDTRSDK